MRKSRFTEEQIAAALDVPEVPVFPLVPFVARPLREEVQTPTVGRETGPVLRVGLVEGQVFRSDPAAID